MKIIEFALLIGLVYYPNVLFSQNGYLVTSDDSTKVGYLSKQRVFGTTNKYELIYRTNKKDKRRISYPLSSVKGYAIKRDTIAVLSYYYPFEERDIFIELLEVRQIEGGSITLYFSNKIETPEHSWTYAGSGQSMYTGSLKRTYLLDNGDGYIVGIDRNNFQQEIRQYIDLIRCLNELKIRKLQYDHIPEMVRWHNKQSIR